jgi:cytochrome oxidase Cu insertion factor (SCO1/SenC/PrrC family)
MKPQRSFRSSSIRIKLLLVIAAAISFALLSAGISLLSYEAFQDRDTARRELTTLAEIVGDSSTAALTFADEPAAKETLTSLRGDPRIVVAAVYNAERFYVGGAATEL